MGIKDDAARRRAETVFAAQSAANNQMRKVASVTADQHHQVLLTRIAEQRALRLAKASREKPSADGKNLLG